MKKRIIAISPIHQALYDDFRQALDDAASRFIGQTLPLPAYYAHYLEPLDKALSGALAGLPSGSSAHFAHAHDEHGNRVLQIEALIPDEAK